MIVQSVPCFECHFTTHYRPNPGCGPAPLGGMNFPFQYRPIDNNVCFVLARVLHIVMHEERGKVLCCLVSARIFGRRAFIDGVNSSRAAFRG